MVIATRGLARRAATFGASDGPAITTSFPFQWNQIGTTRGEPSCQV
jgi:hypothetical protein